MKRSTGQGNGDRARSISGILSRGSLWELLLTTINMSASDRGVALPEESEPKRIACWISGMRSFARDTAERSAPMRPVLSR
jgi:hypothetical protein